MKGSILTIDNLLVESRRLAMSGLTFTHRGADEKKCPAFCRRYVCDGAKNHFAALRGRRYIRRMTATAEQVLEKIKRLPPADLREVCQAVIRLTAQADSAPSLQENVVAPVAAQEEDDANEASFFAALAELRERGVVRLDTPGFAQ